MQCLDPGTQPPPNRLNPGKQYVIDEAHLKAGVNRFVPIRAELNTSKALKPCCFIKRENGEQLWLAFKYERLSDFCYNCGRISHIDQACGEPKVNKQDDDNEFTGFGPWMRAVHLNNH